MVKNQNTFCILPSFTFEIIKTEMEEKQKVLFCKNFVYFEFFKMSEI